MAMKIPGRAAYAAARAILRIAASPPPSVVSVTAAQFMYISRFPTSLCHVHASTWSPAGASSGTVKARLLVPSAGQPPMKLRRTVKVAAPSVDSEIWHEPPPCAAPPVMVMLALLPMAKAAVGAPAGVPRSAW